MPCTTCNDDDDRTTAQDCGANKCHEVVDTYADIIDIRNAFVTVRDENAVYHIDSIGNPVAVSRSALYIAGFQPVTGAYKQNTVYDFSVNKGYVFDQLGNFKTVTLS